MFWESTYDVQGSYFLRLFLNPAEAKEVAPVHPGDEDTTQKTHSSGQISSKMFYIISKYK